MSKKIAVVVLAAGKSSRMGSPKQLLNWGGNTLIGHVLEEVSKVRYAVHIVVLGSQSELIQQEVNHPFKVLVNTRWQEGMGSSIALATSHLKQEVDAIQFLVVDQPQVDAMFLKFFLHTYEFKNQKIIATKYHDSIGIPALFDKEYFTELEGLNATGAKVILEKYFQNVKTISPAQTLKDMDTPKGYQELYLKVFGKLPKM